MAPPPPSSPLIRSETPFTYKEKTKVALPFPGSPHQLPRKGSYFLDNSPPSLGPIFFHCLSTHTLPAPESDTHSALSAGSFCLHLPHSHQLCPIQSACYPTFKVQGPTETPPSLGSLLGSSNQGAPTLSSQSQSSAKAPLAATSLCPALGIPG